MKSRAVEEQEQEGGGGEALSVAEENVAEEA